MGIYGIKINENDSFDEIEELFKKRLLEGKNAEEVAKTILQEYINHPDYHIVQLTIVHCLWRSNIQLKQISMLVETIPTLEKNDELYWKSLGATKENLIMRKRALGAFFEKISKPPSATQQWQTKNSPVEIKKGNIFWYRCKNDVFGAVVLDIQEDYYLIAISEKLYDNALSWHVIKNSKLYTVAWFWKQDLLAKNRMHVIDNVNIQEDFNNRAGFFKTEKSLSLNNIGNHLTWKHERRYLIFEDTMVTQVLNTENLPKYM